MHPDSIAETGRVPHGGEPDRSLLDFSANINPQIPDGVETVYADALERARRYPDDTYPVFREAAAEYVGCTPDAVIATPGGLAAIRLSLECTLEAGDTALVPYPSFGEYAREVRLQGATPAFVPHDDLYDLEVPHLEQADLAVCCTPNNPTGDCPSNERLEAFARRCGDAGTTLLVDEAFLGFTDRPSMASRGFEHVVVARSLTKLFGLPGLRAGFAVATGDLGERLAVARRAWSLGTPEAAVGAHCMRDRAFVRETRARVDSERERVRTALLEDGRYDVYDSVAPYLLFESTEPVEDLLERARDAGVVLRDCRTFQGLERHVRVAVAERETNDRLLEVLCDA
ncbi:threonine-phosphate decarboxylase [Natronosalvus amylolyticus]|uniref:threonine-phosphate decarboxylase n=1 Tax=Natronosalvus amylolyticus TaxID=2961994 RepID=UPI0020CA0C42|nr:threonine-phosphate decarboxylase [Natronosalvus amylolyticus]